jgi:hypothetical protein
MAYGGIKFDNITFTNAGVDANTTVSGIYKAITSGVTVTGTISGNLVQGATVSGTTVTGTSANFASGVFTTQISGTIGIFGAGSATAPGLAVGVGTTYKPGIYSQGTDQLAISTGGTGRLFVDANGLTKLDSGINAATLTLNSTNPYGTLLNFADTNATFGVIGGAGALVSGADKNDFGINYNGTNASRNLIFSSFGTERMRITSAGLLGLGTSSPGTILDVAAGTGNFPWFTSSAADPYLRLRNTSASGKDWLIYSSGTGSGVAGSLRLFNNTDSISALTIDSSGRLYIGTSTTQSDSSLLNIACPGPTSGNTVIGGAIATATNSYMSFEWGMRVNGVGNKSAINFQLDPGSGGSDGSIAFITNRHGVERLERMRIDSFGRLLVGTSTARSNFFNASFATDIQLERAGDCSLSLVRNSADAASPYLLLGKTRGSSVGANNAVLNNDALGYIGFQGSDGTELVSGASITAEVDATPGANDMPGRLVFSTTADGASSPTERMRITSGGFVGIGTSSVLYTLESASSDDIQISLTRNAVGRWLLGTTSANNLKFAKEGGAEAMRFDASSRVLVGITSANTSGAKLQTVDGLTFPATQVASSDPNTLDDYEEGTFTPTVIGTTTTGTATYTQQTGIYTKIGRQVAFMIYLNWSAGTGTGSLQIQGLPFLLPNITNNSWPVSFGIVDGISVAANTQLNGYATQNSTIIVLTNQVTGGGSYSVQTYDAAGHLLISGNYLAT